MAEQQQTVDVRTVAAVEPAAPAAGEGVANSILHTNPPLDAEQADTQELMSRIRFATSHADPRFRAKQGLAERAYATLNAELFDGGLRGARIGFAQTAGRTLSQFHPRTDYGGRAWAVLSERFAVDADEDWVVRDAPFPGYVLAFNDLLLKAMTRQYTVEVLDTPQDGRGFTAALTEARNRVGLRLGLPPVRERRRGGDDDEPVVAGWPFNVRSAEDYQGDVTDAFLSLAAGGARPRRRRRRPSLGLYDYYHHLLVTGQHERLRLIFERMRDLGEDARLMRRPVLLRMERGELDADGRTPLPEGADAVEDGWLLWNNRTVAHIAEGIAAARDYTHLPVLADALQDAGCDNDPLLRHLYARVEHTHRCFALRAVLAAAGRLEGAAG
jgi:hypothetical protein